ncbi:MAG: hypothetical protein COA96_03165 [SAR86 cluster bacterium]|uniref:ASCH domain-containing protein n=1 Tax=SAR86 cluster bacterium TaxID=2030880 RepID=A0A2A5B7I9_9GAMM|nr:MAG: hypothetical protein COA96_03165 [SAR86 cluster bacterium]
MQFTSKLRERIKNGEITTSIRIWKKPHVKSGGVYRMEEGNIVVTSIREISFEDISESLAKESGFNNIVDLVKTAKHGNGQNIYFINFFYEESDN